MQGNRHTRNLVRLMIASEDRILLAKYVKEETAIYCLPGGGIEFNESLMDAAKRELSEELGVESARINEIAPVAVHEYAWDDKGSPFHEMSIVCVCRLQGLHWTVPVHSHENHLTFGWHGMDDLNRINLLPADFRTLIPAWMDNAGKIPAFFFSGLGRVS